MIPLEPLFDTFQQFKSLTLVEPFSAKNRAVRRYVESIEGALKGALDDYRYAVGFLHQYCKRSEQTFNSYRSEVERLILWSWVERRKPAHQLSREDIDAFFDFVMSPPAGWVTNERHPHFLGDGDCRSPNVNWRPFRITGEIKKTQKVIKRQPSQASMAKQFSILNVFYDYLVTVGLSSVNAIPSVRKQSPYRQSDVRIKKAHRLSQIQWDYVVETMTVHANDNAVYERNLFAVCLMKVCYLRISEIAQQKNWTPMLRHFVYEGEYLWLSVSGKGSKLRSVSVPDSLLPYIKRYLTYLGVHPSLPVSGDTPLFPKLRGMGSIGVRQATRLIEESFRLSVDRMMQDGFEREALSLKEATTHWLRHTGASMDIDHRPLSHIAGELGHGSIATTARIYIDSDVMERAESGRKRSI
jgi:integrase